MRVAIAGGGITGLTTALALHKKGINVEVFEQAPVLNEIGAGIWIQPNALKVLEWLDLKEEVQKEGWELNRMGITNKKLQPFKKIKKEVVQDEKGNQTVAMHRGKFQKILFDAASKKTTVHLGKTYESHKEMNGKVVVTFKDQSTAQFDLLLGADGIHSAVRQNMFPTASLRSTHQVCWRGVAQMKLPADQIKIGQEAWGNKIRFGFSQLNEEEVYWFAVAPEVHLKKADEKGVKTHLNQIFSTFHPVVLALIDKTAANNIHQTVLEDLHRLETWHTSLVGLIGDAAHATTPNMGQGACQGIEDAYHISKILDQKGTSLEQKLEQFENKRRKKVDYVVNNSWRFGKMAHSYWGQKMMKAIIKITPEKTLNKAMNKLYSIE